MGSGLLCKNRGQRDREQLNDFALSMVEIKQMNGMNDWKGFNRGEDNGGTAKLISEFETLTYVAARKSVRSPMLTCMSGPVKLRPVITLYHISSRTYCFSQSLRSQCSDVSYISCMIHRESINGHGPLAVLGPSVSIHWAYRTLRGEIISVWVFSVSSAC